MYDGTDLRNVKTPATVLQEMMVKRGLTPEYKCVGQSGPQHQATFEYMCMAAGVVGRASARSKKDAKQAAARRALSLLAAQGAPVPPPYNAPLDDVQEESPAASSQSSGVPAIEGPSPGTSTGGTSGSAGVPIGSHVALLKELCEQYRLPAPDYSIVADTGPPHNRHFTICAQIGKQKFMATAHSKRAARQAAATKLYTYLRENLARLTKDFDEEDALIRAHEKAMERYEEVSSRETWKPNLGQKISEYHLGLRQAAGPGEAEAALQALEQHGDTQEGVEAAMRALGLEVEADVLDKVNILRVPHATPTLAFASVEVAARYIRLTLTMSDHSADLTPAPLQSSTNGT